MSFTIGIYINTNDCLLGANFKPYHDFISVAINPTSEFMNTLKPLCLDLYCRNEITLYDMIYKTITDQNGKCFRQITIYCHKNIEAVVASVAAQISKIYTPSPNTQFKVHTFDNEHSKAISDITIDQDLVDISTHIHNAYWAKAIAVDTQNNLLGYGSNLEETLILRLESYHNSSYKSLLLMDTARWSIHSKSDTVTIYTKRFSHKINSFGEYTKYHGMTVVSHVAKKHYDIFEQLLTELREKVGHIYSVLPVDSLHMTVFNMFTQSIQSSYTEEEIASYKKKVNKFKTFGTKFCPENKGKQMVKIDSFYGHTTLGSTFGLKVTPMWDIQKQRKILSSVTGLEDKSLNKGNFHITFGYNYNNIEISEELKKEIEVIFKRYRLSSIEVEEPEVCEFFDMTKFIPVKPKSTFSKYINPITLAMFLQ